MDKTNTGTKKLIIVSVLCAMLLAAVIALAVSLGVYVDKQSEAKISAENGYRAEYFKLKDSVLDMENSLSKLSLSATKSMQTQLLVETAVSAELAARSLDKLSDGDDRLHSTMKFCNQVHDYSKYLVKKIGADIALTDDEREVVSTLHDAAMQLGIRLSAMQDEMSESGYYFIERIESGDPFADVVAGVADEAVKYPTLIYDGPFSDGLDDPTPHSLSGEEIDEAGAKQAAAKYLSDYELVDLQLVSECGGSFDSYLLGATTSDGKRVSVQISKIGGHLVMFDVYEEMVMPTFSVAEGVEVAKQYCAAHGYDSLKAVWSTVSQSELFVNMCYEKDGIIFYPDMIKIKVSLQTGKVIGFESLGYIFNHDRDEVDYSVTKTEQEIAARYRDDFSIESVRLAVIPLGGGREKLAYEVYGLLGDYKFFVYVDAETGEEIEMMQVIDSDDGELLM